MSKLVSLADFNKPVPHVLQVISPVPASEVAVTLTIIVTKGRMVELSGPVHDLALCEALLGYARDRIKGLQRGARQVVEVESLGGVQA